MYKYPMYSAPMLIPNPKNPHELKVSFVSHPKFHKEPPVKPAHLAR